MVEQSPKQSPAQSCDIDIAALVDRLSVLLELPIAPEYRPGVIANLERTHAIAQLMLDFPLPVDLEIAPIFHP